MGRALENGRLYLVTGCEKALSSSWGMTSFQLAPSNQANFQLSFRPRDGATSGYKYRWSPPTLAHRDYADPLTGGDHLNQTLFIHAFAISLSEGLWATLFGQNSGAQLVHYPQGSTQGGGSVPYTSQG